MKNTKNKSVTNNYVIFGLALVLLFLSACGKKDNTDEIILPSEIKQNKDLETLAVKVSELPTQTDEKDRVGKVKNLVADQNLANTNPEYFDTGNSEDETTETDPLANIKIYGQAVRTDGTAITNLFIKATPRGIYELAGNPGHVAAKIKADERGYFEINDLIPDNYKLYICANDSDTITTNVVLYSDSANNIKFIFPEMKYQTIKGIVKYEITDEPAEGIKIKCESGTLRQTITTGIDGKFEITLPVVEKKHIRLKINENGYAKGNWPIYLLKYKGELITLLLKKTGIITGKITNKSGKPLSGISVIFYPEREYDSKSIVSFSSGRGYRTRRYTYIARTETPSNVEGIYVISNAAAPEAYTLNDANGQNAYWPVDKHSKGIEVFPGLTTTFDFTMLPKPVVKIQVKDKQGNPILKYTLKVLTKYINSYLPKTYNVNLSDENDWHDVHVWLRNKEAKLSLTANTQDGHIWANTKSGFASCQSDHLGFFELSGVDVEKGTRISLSTCKGIIMYSASVRAGDNNFEWILPELKLITGRVCIKNSATPATNFAVSVIKPFSKKYFRSEDGTFSIQFNAKYARNKIKVYIFATGYATESREINLQKLNSYDFGDIIVMNKPATVIGRMVNEKDNPVICKIILENIGNSEKSMTVKPDDSDGSFEFIDVPPGRYRITASSQSNNVESETFELSSGEYYTLPDLILH